MIILWLIKTLIKAYNAYENSVKRGMTVLFTFYSGTKCFETVTIKSRFDKFLFVISKDDLLNIRIKNEGKKYFNLKLDQIKPNLTKVCI